MNEYNVEDSLKDPLEIDKGIKVEIEDSLPNTVSKNYQKKYNFFA